MKKHFLKSFALLAMLFSALTLSAQSGVDWSTIAWIGNGSGDATYTDKYKCSTTEGLDVIQFPGFATEVGIYMTFPAADINCNISGYDVQGAGIIMHLSSFTAQETEVTVTYAGGSRTFWIYYADGTTGESGGDEGGEGEEEGGETSMWDAIDWITGSDNLYKISSDCISNNGTVEAPAWANNVKGIYITVPSGISSTSIEDAVIMGAGVLLPLTAFTHQETEVTITHALGECTLLVYYANGLNWDNEDWIIGSDNKYKIISECISNNGTVEAPAWANNVKGIYITVPSGISSTSIEDAVIMGAGVLLPLTAFTHQETEVTITHALGECTLLVYYSDGIPGVDSGEGGGEEEPEETIITDTYFAPNWAQETNSTATYDATTGAITVDLQSTFSGQWQAQVKVKHDVDFSTDKQYTFSAKFHATANVEKVTIKVDDNNGMIFEDQSVTLPANTDFVYTSTTKDGIEGNNKIIVFDFGYATPCQITISDIVIEETDKPADEEAPVMVSASLVAGSETHNSAVLTVSATDNNEVANYHVVDGANGYNATIAPVGNQITLTGLTPSTDYNFTVTALDLAGNESTNNATVAVSTIALLYCDFATGHNDDANFGNPDGRIFVSLIKITPQNVRVVVKSADAATKNLDLIYIEAAGANPHATTVGADAASSDLRVMSADISYPTIPAKYDFMIQWSNPDWDGRWQINLKDVLESNLCPLPADEEAPVMVSASLVTGSETYNSAVLTVSATDNDEVANYHVVDATNNYDETIAPVGDKITLTDLTPSTTYNFTVTAVDLAGNESANNKTIVVTTDALVYCDFPTGHQNNANFSDPNGRCLLTLTKLGNTQIRITVKPNYDNGATQKLDFLYVVANGANPNPATVGDPKLSEGGVDALSVDINYQTLTYPIGSIEIKWSTIGMDGEWATTVTNILESNLCLPIIVDENTDPATLPNGATCDVQFAREMTVVNDIWNTIALPFGMNAEQIARTFGEGTLVAKLQRSSSVASLEEMKLRFDYVDEIEAGTPYIILPMESGKDVVISGVTINTTPNPIVANQVTMHPVLKTISYNYDNGDPIKFFLAADGYLHYNEASNQIKGLRAYFTFDNVTTIAQASKVRARIVFDENTETSVDNITMDEVPVKVIQHGQLIIIRNGVKYNVQGQKL